MKSFCSICNERNFQIRRLNGRIIKIGITNKTSSLGMKAFFCKVLESFIKEIFLFYYFSFNFIFQVNIKYEQENVEK